MNLKRASTKTCWIPLTSAGRIFLPRLRIRSDYLMEINPCTAAQINKIFIPLEPTKISLQ